MVASSHQVAGNFHFAPGRSFQQASMHLHDLMPFGNAKFNVSHTIHKLAFGKDFPGAVHPLDGTIRTHTQEGNGIYQYFLKVVPTLYEVRPSGCTRTPTERLK